MKKPFGWELKHLQTGQKSSCFGLKHFSFLLTVWSIIINANYFRIHIDGVVEDFDKKKKTQVEWKTTTTDQEGKTDIMCGDSKIVS